MKTDERNLRLTPRKASPLLGRKFSEGRLQRARDTRARLKAEGHQFGPPVDPATHIEARICQLPSCGKPFPLKVTKGFNPRVRAGRYCKQSHATQHTAILRRKVPADYDLLHRLYIKQNMSTAEIAEMFGTTHHSVLSRLKTLGISRRKGGVSRNVNCDEPGCIEPVLKLKHPQRGYMYGTKCAEHYHAHRKSLYASRYERIKIAKGNITRRILLQLKAGFTTSREIAQRLNVTVQVVATSMGRLKQRGEVEAYGSVMVDRVEQKLWRLVER